MDTLDRIEKHSFRTEPAQRPFMTYGDDEKPNDNRQARLLQPSFLVLKISQ
jgi:hypothetical protein